MNMRSILIGVAALGMAGSTAALGEPVGERSSDDGGARFHDCGYDFNGDGVGNFFDVIDFINALIAGDDSADLNGDGVIDWFDVVEFIDLYLAGC